MAAGCVAFALVGRPAHSPLLAAWGKLKKRGAPLQECAKNVAVKVGPAIDLDGSYMTELGTDSQRGHPHVACLRHCHQQLAAAAPAAGVHAGAAARLYQVGRVEAEAAPMKGLWPTGAVVHNRLLRGSAGRGRVSAVGLDVCPGWPARDAEESELVSTASLISYWPAGFQYGVRMKCVSSTLEMRQTERKRANKTRRLIHPPHTS